MTQYANSLHETLSKVTLDEAIRLVEALVQQRGYHVMFHDVGVRAWVADNTDVLRPLAAQRRATRGVFNGSL